MGIRIEAPWTPGCQRLRSFYLRKDQWKTISSLASAHGVTKGMIVRALIESWWEYDLSTTVDDKSHRLRTFLVDPYLFQDIESRAECLKITTQTLLRSILDCALQTLNEDQESDALALARLDDDGG